MKRLLAAFALSACASTSPEPAFSDVAKQIAQRTGKTISWNQAGTDDEGARRAVQRLLAQELSVAAATQVALLNNRSLQALYEELGVAQADLVQAGLLKNPTFSAGITTAERDNIDPNVIFGVSQDFLDLLLLPARKKLAGAQLEQAKMRVGAGVIEVVTRVRRAYFILKGAEHMLEMRRQVAAAGEVALDLAAQQNEAGNSSDLDLANERATYAQLSLDVARGELEAQKAREELAKVLGLFGADVAFRIPPRLPDLPVDDPPLVRLESAAVSQRLDLAAARQERQAIAYALGLVRSSRWTGAIDVGVDAARLRDGALALGPRASLELPLFDQRQAAIARLEALERQSARRYEALAIDIRSEVRTARTQMLAARRVAQHFKAVLIPTRADVVRLSQEQYDAMLLGVYQLLQAKQNEVNSYRDYLDALRDYWIARADLERAVGGKLPSGVAVDQAASPAAAPSPAPPAAAHQHHHS